MKSPGKKSTKSAARRAKKRKQNPKPATQRRKHGLALWIHREIQSGSYPNAQKLVALFGGSTDAVYRAVRHLRLYHKLPVEWDAVKNGYYYSEPVGDISELNLTEGELFAWVVAQKALSSFTDCGLITQRLRDSLNKLSALLPNEIIVNLAELDETVTFHNATQAIERPEIHELFVTGCNQRLELEILYETPGKPPAWRVVEPYSFSALPTGWYLFARDEKRGKVITFRPSRTLDGRKTGKTFVRPKFTVAEFLKGSFNVFSGDGEYNIIIRFRKNVAHRVRENRWPGQQQLIELANGDLELHLKLTSLVEVHPWLLTFEGDAFPIAPPELVQRHACVNAKMQGNLKGMGL